MPVAEGIETFQQKKKNISTNRGVFRNILWGGHKQKVRNSNSRVYGALEI